MVRSMILQPIAVNGSVRESQGYCFGRLLQEPG